MEILSPLRPRGTGILLAWLLLAYSAMPQAAVENPQQACAIDKIKASFGQMQPGEDLIGNLQEDLQDDGFGIEKISKKLDDDTASALARFCLEVASKSDSFPQQESAAAGGALAEFLLDQVIEYQPSPAQGGSSDDANDQQTNGQQQEGQQQEGQQQEGQQQEGQQKAGDPEPQKCSVEVIREEYKPANGPRTGEVQRFLKAGGYLTDWADEIRGPETYHALARLCRHVTTAAAGKAEFATALAELMSSGETEAIAALLRRQHSNIAISATEDCACSRDFAAPVYGFLPNWLASGEDRIVDFSLLDRIGFHALQLDANGNITNPDLWREASEERPSAKAKKTESRIGAFIAAAHKHRVWVDISFYTSGWKAWGSDETQAAIEAILDSVDERFSTATADDSFGDIFIRWLRKIFPFVEDNSSVKVDGVNLYLDDYSMAIGQDLSYASCAVDESKPEETEAGPWCNVSRIVDELSEKLYAQNPDLRLNLMLGLDWHGMNSAIGIDSATEIEGLNKKLFAGLERILTENIEDSDRPKVAGLFVFLPRNTGNEAAQGSTGSVNKTSFAKKYLRRVIEDAYDGKGLSRRTVLRKTVPILATAADAVRQDYFEKGQFFDDLIYLQDNFAGAGLWPLPLTPEITQASLIGSELENAYAPASESSHFVQDLDTFTERLCSVACPNRWLFRLTFDLLLAGLLIYALLALGNCRLREFYQQKFLYFFCYSGATAAVFAVSLLCDPFWKERSDLVMWGLLLALTGYLGFRYIRKSMQPKYP